MTNSQGMMPGRSSLDRMEAELNGPLKAILKGNSLDGMIMPAPRMVPPTGLQPRSTDDADRKREQMLLGPEDLYSVHSIEDIYKAVEMTPDGRRVKDLGAMDKWIMRTLGAGQGTNRVTVGTPGGSVIVGNNFGVSGQPGMNPPENLLQTELKKIFGMDPETLSRNRDQRADELYGLGAAQKISTEEFQRRESFMQNLDPNYVPTQPGATRGAGFSTPYVNSSFYDPPKAAPVAPPSYTATPAASAQPDLWKSALVTPPPAPLPQPAPAPMPSSPFMNTPRRSF